MPVVNPDVESGGPRIASPRSPRDQDAFADLIPAADMSVGPIGRNVNTGTFGEASPPTVMHRRVDEPGYEATLYGRVGQRFSGRALPARVRLGAAAPPAQSVRSVLTHSTGGYSASTKSKIRADLADEISAQVDRYWRARLRRGRRSDGPQIAGSAPVAAARSPRLTISGIGHI
jgi:hypothetical protein